jgi:RNA polymerase sigma-70 factor, ECF subfamily
MSIFRTRLQDCLPDLWRYGYALSMDRDLADDLVQDSAERALRKQHLWDKSRPLKPWLMTILLNQFRSHARRAGHLRLVQLDEDHHAANPPTAPVRLELAETTRAIQGLPPAQREALLLVVIGGLDYKAAAEVLDIPIGTVMSRISRARATLREKAADPRTTNRKGST